MKVSSESQFCVTSSRCFPDRMISCCELRPQRRAFHGFPIYACRSSQSAFPQYANVNSPPLCSEGVTTATFDNATKHAKVVHGHLVQAPQPHNHFFSLVPHSNKAFPLCFWRRCSPQRMTAPRPRSICLTTSVRCARLFLIAFMASTPRKSESCVVTTGALTGRPWASTGRSYFIFHLFPFTVVN